MRAYIKKIQMKPENVRKQIFFTSMIVCMSLVGVIWISSLGYKFSNTETVKIENEIKPFALFAQTVSETYNNVSASVGNISSGNKEIEKEKEVEVVDQKIIDLTPVEYQ